ncbi:PREDICTED: putative gustatory receptor 2a [Vollenhovia emeryi]|uniref:putative gustatory receptor 2a n=1 Tax=Vollenhovia emeryi TaxID=411798 RepID=UPI0005F54946|nr:PREDICTED: putative gustatory receptor 2a [Vollenhovia emeryi]
MRLSKRRVLKRHSSKQGAAESCAERIKPYLLLFKVCGLFANDVTGGTVKHCPWPTYEDFDLVTIVRFSKHITGYISMSTVTITAYSSQNDFIKCLLSPQIFDRLDAYDYKAARIKNKRTDSAWIIWIVTLLITFVILLLIYATYIEIVKFPSDYVFFLSNTYAIILHMYFFLEQFILLYKVLERFKHLNKNIAANVSWDEKRRESNTIDISDVKIMHLMLYDAHVAFNNIYRNSQLSCIAYLMMCIVANISFFREESLLIASTNVGPPLMLLLLICIICHQTAEEANNIACVLNKGMTVFVNPGKTMAKISTLTYFLHYRVSFDAAGFFIIDLPFFQSIVAAITTYFIILV